MNIVLTGGTGFLGTHLLRRLLEDKHHVKVIKRTTSQVNADADVDVEYLDIGDPAIDGKLAASGSIDAVIHLATNYGKGGLAAAVATLETNVRLPLQLLDIAYSTGCRLFISTDSFFSAKKFNYRHLAEYNLTKQQFLAWGQLMSQKLSDLAFVNMRLEHVYGPNDNHDKFIPYLLCALQSGREKIELTDGLQKRDFIYVNDVVEAYVAVLANLPRAGGFHEFEVGTGSSMSVRELVETAAALTRSSALLDFGAISQRAGEIMNSCADNRTLTQLGWQPATDVSTGLQAILSKTD